MKNAFVNWLTTHSDSRFFVFTIIGIPLFIIVLWFGFWVSWSIFVCGSECKYAQVVKATEDCIVRNIAPEAECLELVSYIWE